MRWSSQLTMYMHWLGKDILVFLDSFKERWVEPPVIFGSIGRKLKIDRRSQTRRPSRRLHESIYSRLKAHCDDPHKLPILIFPEGTCINNTSVMMFKKGSFEVGTTIYPIAMKYDSRFGDPFWNSTEQSWFEYIMRMMTSWAIICNVWYLPPMTKHVGLSFLLNILRLIGWRGCCRVCQ